MNKVSKIGQLANLVLYLTLQMAVARYMVLFHTAFCFVYVAFLLLLPRRQENLATLLFISFAVGLLVDMFYNSLGLHAFAAVLMVYSRSNLLPLILPTNSYEAAARPTLNRLGLRKFALFALPLIGIHHAALFLLDAGNASLSFVAMRKLLFSTLWTYGAVLATQIPSLLLSKR
ncbi:MAG: hypothetical protein AAF963_00055 [Bacteroidota bacterium]